MDDRCLREQEFHDTIKEQSARSMEEVRLFFEGRTSPENRFLLGKLGSLKGKQLLDLGCGSTGSSVYFARRGAIAVATDISDEVLRFTRELAEKEGIKIESKVVNAMDIDYPDNSFDIVYAANVLHHTDPQRTLHEIHRVLRPGGQVAIVDPLRHNPIINVYRRMASKVRSEDEQPLDISIVEYCKSLFTDVAYDTFWLLSLWIFLSFYIIEGVHPNEERYWIKVVREEERLGNRFAILNAIDSKLKKFAPFIDKYAWNIALVGRK